MKTLPYAVLRQRLHRSAFRRHAPLRVMFELTYRCNFNCRHCYIPKSYRRKEELSTAEVFSVLDGLKDAGCFYLGFTGGEPFMRKDILSILRYAREKGFEVIVYTNGSLIDEARAAALKELRINKVDITIPAMSKVAFERISGKAGSRDKVFRAVKRLYKKKVPLGFKTCVLKDNAREIGEIQEFCRSLGAFHRLDDMLSPRLNGSAAPYRYRPGGDLSLPPERSGACPPAGNTQLFKCGVGVSQAAITPAGELKLCLMIGSPRFRMGKPDIPGKGFGAAWSKLRKFVSSIRPDEHYICGTCTLRSRCKWCPARAWLYNRTFTCCEPASRYKAERS